MRRAVLVLAAVLLVAAFGVAWQLGSHVDAVWARAAALESAVPLPNAKQACTLEKSFSKPALDAALGRAAALDADLAVAGLPLSRFAEATGERARQVVAEAVLARSVYPALACGLTVRAARLATGLGTSEGAVPADQPPGPFAHTDTRARLMAQATAVRELENQLQRFRRLAAPGVAGEDRVGMLDGLYRYLYGDGLPAAAAQADGVVALSLDQVPYRGTVAVPSGMREHITRQLAGIGRQWHDELLAEVGAGPALLSTLQRPGRQPLAASARRFTVWLAWVDKAWLPLDTARSPCTDAGKQWQGLVAPLVRDHGYPASLLEGKAGFDAAGCDDPAVAALRAMQLPPYGALLLPPGPSAAALNPALAAELPGLTALLARRFMQAPDVRPFACNGAAAGWRAADVERALSYGTEYGQLEAGRKLASRGGAGLDAALADRIAGPLIEQAMNDALGAAQMVPTDPALADEARLQQHSAEFARALAPLLASLQFQAEAGLAASHADLAQCVRAYAGRSLELVSALAAGSQLYIPAPRPHGDETELLFDLGGAPAVKDYLAQQLARARVLTAYASPLVDLLRATDTGFDARPGPVPRWAYWNNTREEVARPALAAVPGGQVQVLETLFSQTLADLHAGDCRKTLAGYRVPDYGNDLFSVRRWMLMNALRDRCGL